MNTLNQSNLGLNHDFFPFIELSKPLNLLEYISFFFLLEVRRYKKNFKIAEIIFVAIIRIAKKPLYFYENKKLTTSVPISFFLIQVRILNL